MSIDAMAVVTPHVFISYRDQDDTARTTVEQLAPKLKDDLGGVRVFYAESDVPRGDDFLVHMYEHLDASSSVLVAMGPEWERDIADRARAGADDWVRLEVAAALAKPDPHVLPLLVDRRTSPARDVLPEDVRAIATTRGLADFSLERDYHHVLFDVWTAHHRRLDPAVRFVVADETARGEVVLERFLADLDAKGALDVERFRQLSQHITAPQGMAAVPLISIVEGFDGDVLLLEPRTIRQRWRRRRAMVDGWVARHPGATVNVLVGNVVLGGSELAGYGPSSWPRRFASWWDRATLATKAGVATITVVAAGIALAGGGAEATAFTYADLAYQTGDLDIVALHPDVDPDVADEDPDVDYALLDLAVSSELPDSTYGLRYSQIQAADTWALEVDDGTQIPAAGVLTDDVDWMNTTWGLLGLENEAFRLVFPVDAGTGLNNPVLHMRVNEMTPVVVPLDGSEVTSAAVDVEVSNQSWEGPFSFGRARFEVIDAWASLEAGSNESTGEPYVALESGLQRRAEDGHVFLHVDLEVVGIEFGGSMVGSALLLGDHRVEADGQDHPATSDFSGVQLPEEPERYHVVGAVPLDASQVRLVVEQGSGGGDDYVIDVDPTFLDSFRDL